MVPLSKSGGAMSLQAAQHIYAKQTKTKLKIVFTEALQATSMT